MPPTSMHSARQHHEISIKADTIITCAPDALVIRHPDILSALKGFREYSLRKWLPRLLAADLPAVARQLLAHVFSGWSEEEKTAATAAIALVSPQRIEAHLREWITPQIPHSSPKLLVSLNRTLRLPEEMTARRTAAHAGRPIEHHDALRQRHHSLRFSLNSLRRPPVRPL